MVLSGIPSHGKSTFALNLLCNLAKLHGWRSVVFSPEMPTVPHLRDKLRRIKGGDRPDADAFIEEYFRFLDVDPVGKDDEDFDVAWIIDRATDAVMRDGIRVLLIDPWNEVEHARLREETMAEYIGRAIRALKRFARLYEVAVIVIAHPTKEVGRDGKSRVPTMYDIDGSAHWFNKADHGLILDCQDFTLCESTLYVKKVRFDETGEKGEVRLRYDKMSCRYETLDAEREAL